MNGMTMSNACMYDEVEEIRNLNKVEGFDPRRYMRLIQNEGQAAKYYLDVAYRKLRFRLRYQEGKIVKKILKLTEQVAIVEARVYLNRNDDEDNFISNALAQKYMTGDGQFGNKFVELAETAAVGRALSDAEFGLQFADREGDIDPEVTEAPFDPQMVAGMGGTLSEGIYMDSAIQEGSAGDGEILPEEIFPGQHGIEEYISMPEDVGQVAVEKPANLQWYVDFYGGSDNLLRAAAKFLNSMERGKAQYIVNAVLAYQNGAQTGDVPYAGQAVDYEKIRQFVLQVIREHERQETPRIETARETAWPGAAEEMEGTTFGLDEDALNGIMLSLEAFKG